MLNKIFEQEEYVKTLIVQLKKIKKIKEPERSVEVYEGKNGLKALFTELSLAKEMCFFGVTGRSYEVLRWEMPKIAERVLKLDIKGRGIADIKMKEKLFPKIKNLLENKFEIRYLPHVESHATSTAITPQMVAISCLAEEIPLVVIIKEKSMAKTYKNYFECLWDRALV